MKHIVAVGNLRQGFLFVGPYDTPEQAAAAAQHAGPEVTLIELHDAADADSNGRDKPDD